MNYRELDADGDYSIGRFLVDSPAAVAQAVQTRLRLLTGEWFLDLSGGTPYDTRVLGYNTQATRDLTIKERILGTPGVTGIASYASSVVGRKMTVVARVDTLYGAAQVETTL
jgi:hypothetical protein